MTQPDTTRLEAFALAFLVIAAWEFALPRRRPATSKTRRWAHTLALMAMNTALIRLVFSIAPVEFAELAYERGWGLLNHHGLSGWHWAVLAVIALDLAIYLQHVMFHAVPLFWRFHMAHHADVDFDLTTGVRFHPAEMVVTTAIKLAAVALIGAPPGAVLVYEILLNGFSMFIHSNAKLNLTMDRLLRPMVVTPDMHRVHHSILGSETNTNFGAVFGWWDRLAGTYKSQPSEGHDRMTIGLARYRDVLDQPIWWILALPFKGKSDLPVRPIGK